MHYDRGDQLYICYNVDIYKFKAKYSKINAFPLFLGNVSKDFWVDNMNINLDYVGISIIFQLIIIAIMLLMFLDVHKNLMKQHEMK